MSDRWGWLVAAFVAAVVGALLFVVRKDSCYATSDGPQDEPVCASAPFLGNGLTWFFAALIGFFVLYCLVHALGGGPRPGGGRHARRGPAWPRRPSRRAR